MKTKKNVKNVVKYTVLIIWTFVSLFPLYYMLMFSLKIIVKFSGQMLLGCRSIGYGLTIKKR